MRAVVIEAPGEMRATIRQRPSPGAGELLVRVEACGVCRTDLHLLDGELSMARYPVIPGHQVVGVVEANGSGSERFSIGDRVGIPWLGWTCGECERCRAAEENLCPDAEFTGCHRDGGFAEYAVADERFCVALSPDADPGEIAPLLCGGLIGYRCLRACGNPRRLGIYGFGSAAHIVTRVAVHEGREVYAFARPGDQKRFEFARRLGAAWAGPSDDRPPSALDAAIIFAPAGNLVVEALRSLRPGGRVICGGIHMSDIPSFPYELLWGERSIASIANLTRRDAEEFFELAGKMSIETVVTPYRLDEAARALDDLRLGRLEGSVVLQISEGVPES